MVASEAQIVNQRVKPDVGDEEGVKRKFDTPRKPCLWTGDAEMPPIASQER